MTTPEERRGGVRRLAAVLAVVAVLAPTATRAQDAERKAAAQALFDEGKALMAAGRTSDACRKFLQSLQALPQLGTRLNLADCYERDGRLASAWAEFRQAAAAAERAGDPRGAYARGRVAELEGRVPRLELHVAGATPGLEITLDGVALDAALWGTPLPVDPGVRALRASAPGREPWTQLVTIPGERQLVAVEVPALAARPMPAVPRPRRRGWVTASLVVGGVGVVSVGAGVFFGLQARSAWSDADPLCSPSGVCTPQGAALARSAGRDADVATGLLVAGGAAVITGVALYVWAPRERRWAVAPVAGAGGAGLQLSGVW